MTEVALLYALALLDGAFVGYRDAVGRNPLLDKRTYYRAALAHGLGVVLVPIAIITATAAISYRVDPGAVRAAVEPFASTMLVIYGAYATLVLLVFCAYLIDDYDVRSFITISAFGSLTFARPFVVIGGAGFAGVVVAQPVAWPTAIAIATTMGLLQPAVAWLRFNEFDWDALAPRRASE